MSLSRALELWIAVTGVDPSRKAFRWGDMDVLSMHQALKEALELDDTEITGRLLFAYLATEYMRERSFSVEELLEQPDKVAAYLQQSRELRSYLNNADLQAIRHDFTTQLTKAAQSYGATGADVTKMLGEPHTLAILRRDAMRTLKHLQINQFLDGAPEPEAARPAYGKFIYQWRNINSMLQVLTTMPSGVTVNLICHPTNPYYSYFAFAIRNGGKLFVFTDKEKTPHPMAADLMRRPDRVLAERAARNWFPYELMGLAFTDEGEAYIRTTEQTGLVPIQAKALPVKPISELEAPQVLWLSMMLDLIVQKFWRQGYCAPELSYTGEMVKIEGPLLAAAQQANLPVAGYQPLALKPLSLAEVRHDAVEAKHVGKQGNGAHKWLEDRYGHLVPDVVLNVMGTPDQQLALEFKQDGASQVVSGRDPKALSPRFFDDPEVTRPSRIQLDLLDATSFGTREDLEADRRFIARSNYAKEIDRLARVEFADRSKSVIAWVRQHIEVNLPKLNALLSRPEVRVAAKRAETFGKTAGGWHGQTNQGYRRTFATRTSLLGDDAWRRKHLGSCYSEGNIVFQGAAGWNKPLPPCYVTGAPASYYVQLYPETTEDLAFLCGCLATELPDVLQHWTQFRPHVGNSILNRIDPIEWQCADPWQELAFQVTFMLSIRAMKAIDKNYGAAPLPGGFFAG